MSWWDLKSWRWNRKKLKRNILTLSEADKILREDIYFLSVHRYTEDKFKAVFHDENMKYAFEILNLSSFDIQMMYTTYPMLYNYVESLPF